MNTDFRVAIDFPDHPKTKRLIREFGPEGVLYLLRLWAFAANNNVTGCLANRDDQAISDAAGWEGDPGVFVAKLIELRWIDVVDNVRYLHGWTDFQSWIVGTSARQRRAHAAAQKRWEQRRKSGLTRHMRKHQVSNATDNAKKKSSMHTDNAPLLSSPFLSSPFLSSAAADAAACAARSPDGDRATPSDCVNKETNNTISDPVMLAFPVKGPAGHWELTESDYQKLQETFPEHDILPTLRVIKAWLESNPAKQGTRSHCRSRILNWLKRDLDTGKLPLKSATPSNAPVVARNTEQTTPRVTPNPRIVRRTGQIQNGMELCTLSGGESKWLPVESRKELDNGTNG